MASLAPPDQTNLAFRQLAGKRIVVTGGGGFIGSTLLQLLVRHGAVVRAVLGAPGDNVWDPPRQCEADFADISDLSKLLEVMKGAEVVVHAAGPPSVRASFLEPVKCAEVHILGTATVMEACRRTNIKRVVYLSSAEVYGAPSNNPVSEEFPIHPLSPYGAAKAAAEMFVRTMAAEAHIEYCILRLFSVFGPRQSSSSLVSTILCQLRHADCLELNDLEPVRDYCYVQDVAEGIALACVADLNACTLNIGSGEGTSVEEMARLILQLANLDIPIRQKAHSDRPQGTEIYRLIADPSKAKKVLDWHARRALVEGLKETIAWTEQCDS